MQHAQNTAPATKSNFDTLALRAESACQAGHLKTTTPGSQIPLARQREHEAFQNTAPAQRNDTSSFKSYDSRTGPTKTAHHKSSNSRVLRFPTGRAIAQSYERLRTVANGCGRLRRTRLQFQTPKMKREPYATHSGTCRGVLAAKWK